MPETINNLQSSLAMTQAILTYGIYPSRDGDPVADPTMGAIRNYAFGFVPTGSIATSGGLLPISSNTALFSLLGTYFGGDGKSTFALPDLRGNVSTGSGYLPTSTYQYYDLGLIYGSGEISLMQSQLPPSVGGALQPVDNTQPSLVVSYVINAYDATWAGGTSGSLDMVGAVWKFAGGFAPGGTLLCDGQVLDIADYPDLYAVIGTLYGGDGIATFALPDLRGRTPVGAASNAVGLATGAETVFVNQTNLPANMGGGQTPIDNRGPSLSLNYLIATSWIFPDQGSTTNSAITGSQTEPFLGEIVAFAGNYVPTGFLACQGQLLPINQNQALFALLGTTYGGDGRVTFALPDLRGRAIIGADGDLGTVYGSNTFSLTSANVPSIFDQGTSGIDYLYGGDEPDWLQGLDGDDRITGNGGNDILEGGAEKDIINGNAGDDTIDGGAGDDDLDGGDGIDTLSFASATSGVSVSIHDTPEDGRAATGAGMDKILNFENLTGSAYADLLVGNDGANTITGGLHDSLSGEAGDDTLRMILQFNEVAERWSDPRYLGYYEHSAYGGSGFDTLVADFSGAGLAIANAVSEDPDGGSQGSFESYTGSTIHFLVFDSIERFVITGSAQDDQLRGGAGDDSISGGAGADLLNGGGGGDTLIGGHGDDVYYVDDAADVVVENTGQGADWIVTELSVFSMAAFANVERLIAVGSGSNHLTGNSGHNVIDGGEGADTMVGGAGDDTYMADHTFDIVTEGAAAGADLVISSKNYTLGANIENLTLSGSANINGTGNNLANTIIGNSGNNRISGGNGSDKMHGGAGDDTYVVNSGNDKTIELLGGGNDHVLAEVSHTLQAQVERLTLFSVATVGIGNDLANLITGNGAANTLDGRGGADTMTGLGGNDTYVVDNAGDTIIEAEAGGTDLVKSAIAYTLGAHVEDLTLTGTAGVNATGNAGANVITGNSGANVIDGDGGADTMYGGLGNDTYRVDDAGDRAMELNATGGADRVQSSVSFVLGANVEDLHLIGSADIGGDGNNLDNSLIGNSGANLLRGGGGNDRINGAGGNDVLRGGGGYDGFFFDQALGAGNVDSLADFSAAEDAIFLDRSIFGGLTADGWINEAAFRVGTAAEDADDRIVYDAATGNIFYDADGSGTGAAILFATVAAGTGLSHADFHAYTLL